jgi:ABC-2 type transport system ATP-binding protein
MSGLVIERVSHRYGERRALSEVSFQVPPGHFCVLLGPNGAGKSTLFGLLTRLLKQQAGSLTWQGAPLKPQTLGDIGVVFQSLTLDLDLTVQQNLDYFGALFGLSARERKLRIGEELERLGMAERAREKVRALNGGHRRRVEIARALLHHPSLLLLDEPTVGLDAPARRALVDYVHQLSRERGLTVLWATHLFDEVEVAQDDIALLSYGKLRACGPAQQLLGATDSVGQWFDAQTGALTCAA